MAKTAATDVIYQLEITLDHIRPPIWRRVQVKDCTLAKLHDVIQRGFGWCDSHLHEFIAGGERFGDPRQWNDDFGDEPIGDERKMKLSQLAERGVKKFEYVYDMGDDWKHTIKIQKTLPSEAGVRYPRLIAGERACPPEDCGGPWGYTDFLQAIQNREHPQHDELTEWVGGAFDPEAFAIEAVNKTLPATR
jgi:hypothetical protein